MFIRIGTKLQTTIFNLSLPTVKEKLELFNTLVKKTKIDLSSVEKNNSPLFLSSVSILPSSDTDVFNTSTLTRRFLFNDIIGIRSCYDQVIDLMYKSEVFDIRRIINTNHELRNSCVCEKPTISVTEVKTGQLLKKYNNNDLKALPQKVDISENSDVFKYIRRQDEALVSILEEVDHLMIIEGMSTLSEIGDVLNIMAQLGRNTINRIYGLYDMYDYLDPRETLFKILKKYGVPVGIPSSQIELYQQNDKIDRPNRIEMYNTSLFFENTDQYKLTSDELNIFIPFKLYIFLPNSVTLFKDVNTLSIDNSIIDTPLVFSPQRIPSNVGFPKILHGNSPNKEGHKQQTSGNLLPTLTTNNFKLKNTITYIPLSLSSRLLKSKLKLLEDKQMVLGEYGEVIYNIPKSILDDGYMDDFYFFTREQTKAIDKAKTSSDRYSFNVGIEHIVNLSYYTNNTHNCLLNRFASRFYSDYLHLSDFIVCPRLLYEEIPTLEILIKELETKQQALSVLFNNDKQTLLTQEMFLYEKATLLALYLLKKTNKEYFDVLKKCDKEYEYSVRDTVKNNHYHFTQKILRDSIGYDHNITSIGNTRKAYLFETLYVACSEKTNKELILMVKQAVLDATILYHRQINNYIRQFDVTKVVSKYLKRTFGNTQGISYAVGNYTNKYTKNFFYSNSRIYFLLSQEKSEKLLPMLLAEVVSLNYAEELCKELHFLPELITISGESIPVTGSNVIISFLGDSAQQSLILNNLGSNGRKNSCLTKYPILFKTLGESHKIKNTDLGVFINMLLKNFTAQYLSSIKHKD
jgi:hypothetical protein